jgi:hypothetical protein
LFQVEQDSLRTRAAELVQNDPRLQKVPKGDIVISVPTAFVRSLMERLFSDVVDNITLRLSGIKAHVQKTVKKVVKIGEFTLDVEIKQVIGKLRPGRPDMKFGGDRIGMSLPIQVASGHGNAILHFVWDGKNVADLTCGDMDVTRNVDGEVVPASYIVTGALDLKKEGAKVVGTPVFPETRIRLHIQPSKAAWDSINAILDEKRGACGWVLDKVDVPKLLNKIVQEKGINVKLPLQKIKPFLIPAGVRDSVQVGEKTLAVDAKTNLVRIDPDAFWYAADVSIKTVPPESTAVPPESTAVPPESTAVPPPKP